MWVVETLDGVVTAALNALPDDMLAKLGRIGELIQMHGLEQMRAPQVGISTGGFGKYASLGGMA
jgi:hypothetical protein